MIFLPYLKIETKSGKVQKFQANHIQQKINACRKNKLVVLKARQMGVTTNEKMGDLSCALEFENMHCITIADQIDNAKSILKKVKFAFDNLPESFQKIADPKYNSTKEIEFSNNSSIIVDTSARSGTYRRAHISEFAYFSPEKVTEVKEGTFPAVPEGGRIVVESTANGINHFYDFWESCKANPEWATLFFAWYEDSSYRMPIPEGLNLKQAYNELVTKYGLKPEPERYGITQEQLCWYYMRALELGNSVKQEYPFDEIECFLATGRFVFNQNRVNAIKIEEGKEYLGVKIFKEPIAGREYAIGIDTAEGGGNDYSTIAVYDIRDNDIVATYKDNQIRPDQLGALGVKVGEKYNKALIVPESNASGLTTVLKIRELGYPELYRKTTIDKQTRKVREDLGWKTTTANRDLMIDDFIELFDDGKLGIVCAEIVREMRTFVSKENGKREHEDNGHDDLLFACFLAIQGAKHRPAKARAISKPIGF